mmetsp:Transcript_89511/g.155014  ORF Transcript_89511/g.155014 Transcript_89511/m.155014 type:complete len:84 (-) Transcript_89511:309-560(-)
MTILLRRHKPITFQHLTQELEKRLSLMKQEINLHADSPAVLLIDNVSSHIDKTTLVSVDSPTGFTIYHVAGICCWVCQTDPMH